MVIELKDVEHLAGLARIAVSDNEKEVLRHDLEEILAYVSEIKDVATELGESAVGELRNVMRADENQHEPGVFSEDLLAAAPAREGNRVFVKKIL
ncbi:MAG: Asp-tRNA(Asn)/Glu-tRNA(Gln) amidotransferase subunit GatC [Minisyncoccota bacterium]